MMVVGDISALNVLSRIGRVELLRQIHRQIVAPESVRDEVERSQTRLPWWIATKHVINEEHVRELKRSLDTPLAEAIALAKELGADVLLMDEHLGRRTARREGVRVLGLMGVLLLAKRAGWIRSVRDVATEVRLRTGFRVTQLVEAAVYERARE